MLRAENGLLMKRIMFALVLFFAPLNAQALVKCPNGTAVLGIEIPGVTPVGLPRLPDFGPFRQDGIRFLFFCDMFGNIPPSTVCDSAPAMCFLEMVWKRQAILTSQPNLVTTVVDEDRAFDGTRPNRQRCMLNESAAYMPWQFTRSACRVSPLGLAGVLATYEMKATTVAEDTPPDIFIP